MAGCGWKRQGGLTLDDEVLMALDAVSMLLREVLVGLDLIRLVRICFYLCHLFNLCSLVLVSLCCLVENFEEITLLAFSLNPCSKKDAPLLLRKR